VFFAVTVLKALPLGTTIPLKITFCPAMSVFFLDRLSWLGDIDFSVVGFLGTKWG